METRKVTGVVIIVLLVIFVPLAIIGTTLHFKNAEAEGTNTNKEFKQDGKLHFYNNGELLGTYTCEEEDYCDYATLRNTYPHTLDEYQPETLAKTELINNRFAFLLDTTTENLKDAEIILYDVTTAKIVGRYKEIKNYGIGIENDIYLVKNTKDKWGAIEFYDGVNLKIPFVYDYIGLANRIDPGSNHILADTFAVLEEENWKLINSNDKELLPATTEEIYSYNTNYIVLKNNEGMHLIDYDGRHLLNGTYQNINFCNKYVTILENNNHFYLFDPIENEKVSQEYEIESKEDVVLKAEGNNVQIIIKGELKENIAILWILR